MKGSKRLKLLEILADTPTLFEELFLIFTSPYGSSMRQIKNRIYKYYDNKEKERFIKKEEQRFYDLVYRLKNDGLIESEIKNNRKILKITTLGEKILKKLKAKSLLSINKYKKEDDYSIKIIIFDIPEKEGNKRKWLRMVLTNLGFKMLQKSVWVGKVKIPQEFLNDLKIMKLVSYVEIFAVSKAGSLKKIINDN